MKIKLFKKKKVFRKRNFEPSADKYWSIILSVSLVLVLSAFTFGAFLFLEVRKGLDNVVVEDKGQLSLIAPERINKALLYFSARAEKSQEILSLSSPIVDPSL